MVGHRLGEFAPTRTFRGHVTKESVTAVEGGAAAPAAAGAAKTGAAKKEGGND